MTVHWLYRFFFSTHTEKPLARNNENTLQMSHFSSVFFVDVHDIKPKGDAKSKIIKVMTFARIFA